MVLCAKRRLEGFLRGRWVLALAGNRQAGPRIAGLTRQAPDLGLRGILLPSPACQPTSSSRTYPNPFIYTHNFFSIGLSLPKTKLYPSETEKAERSDAPTTQTAHVTRVDSHSSAQFPA
jgi:hypothetical protein